MQWGLNRLIWLNQYWRRSTTECGAASPNRSKHAYSLPLVLFRRGNTLLRPTLSLKQSQKRRIRRQRSSTMNWGPRHATKSHTTSKKPATTSTKHSRLSNGCQQATETKQSSFNLIIYPLKQLRKLKGDSAQRPLRIRQARIEIYDILIDIIPLLKPFDQGLTDQLHIRKRYLQQRYGMKD